MCPPSSAFKFAPLYFLACLKTAGMGITSTAVSATLILELGQPAWVAGLLGAVNNLGFVLFIVFLGNLADRMPRQRAIQVLLGTSVATSAVRLLPLTTPTNIAIFGVFYFVEGGACGLFWCVMQSYAFVAARLGDRRRDEYLAGYNAGWNSGVILGFVLGTVFVALAGSNYVSFWINLILSIAGSGIAFLLERDPETPAPIAPAESPLIKESPGSISTYPVYFVLLLLLVHSFADGSLSVLGPVKVKVLGFDSAVVYALFLVKYATQTLSSALGPRVTPPRLHYLLITCPAIIAGAWALVGLAPDIWWVGVGLAVSGIAQGLLYAAGLKILTRQHQAAGRNQVFAYFQMTMGGGRGIGPFVMGWVADVDFLLSTGIVVGFAAAMSLSAALKSQKSHKNE